MTTLLQLILYMTLLTFVAIMLGAILRNREWTAEGLKAGLSNRDQLPEPTALGGRAERAPQPSELKGHHPPFELYGSNSVG